MALSNWDIYAIDEQSQSTNGVFESATGIAVELYKNWLYIHDEKGWQNGGAYNRPVVAQIWHGSFTYKDVHIRAWRGPKNGIYAFVWSGWEHKKTLKVMAGIGCYGFHDEEWVGVEHSEIAFLASKCPPPINIPAPEYKTMKTDEERERAFALVMQAYDAENARDILDEESIRTLNLQFFSAKRFNQGDAFFAKAFGDNPGIIATNPGETEDPLMIQILKKRPKKK